MSRNNKVKIFKFVLLVNLTYTLKQNLLRIKFSFFKVFAIESILPGEISTWFKLLS